MQRLIDTELFHDGLIPLESPELVARYNCCLVALGIEPSALERFSIDGAGWSPEIAVEQKDPYYLSAGPANPMAVIVTPNQANRPIHFPFNSYDPALLHAYYQRFKEEIADITATCAIGVDIDHELTTYQDPRDLLLVDYVIVRSIAGELAEASREQASLVSRFMAEDLSWFDPALRAQLFESAERYGDLRFRKLHIPEMRFAEFGSFHTLALGGVFVMKSADRKPKMLILEDGGGEHPESGPDFSGSTPIYSIKDAELSELLVAEGFAELNLQYYAANPRILAWKRDTIVAHLLCEGNPELDFGALSMTQRKQQLSNLGSDVPDLLGELERLLKFLNHVVPSPSTLSPQLRRFLLHPAQSLSELDRDVVRRLLSRLHPLDVIELYLSDRNHFISEYRTWSDSKKRWAIDEIQKRALR